MVFNKVFFFLYNNLHIGYQARSRFKQATLLPRGGDDLSLRPRVKEESMTSDEYTTLSSPGKALEGERCCVCLSSMGREEEGVETSILPCLHEFHKVCVNRWFEECQRTCPICRYSMEGGGGRGSHENESNEILTDEMVIWFSSFHTSGF